MTFSRDLKGYQDLMSTFFQQQELRPKGQSDQGESKKELSDQKVKNIIDAVDWIIEAATSEDTPEDLADKITVDFLPGGPSISYFKAFLSKLTEQVQSMSFWKKKMY